MQTRAMATTITAKAKEVIVNNVGYTEQERLLRLGENIKEEVRGVESMVEKLVFFLAKEEVCPVARFYPYAKIFDSCEEKFSSDSRAR